MQRALPDRPHVQSSSEAGIAGLAAATGLAERGVTVDVLEREDYLGGRVGGWTEASRSTTAPPVAMNRGFHAFFRQYYNLRKLLRRVDPDVDDVDRGAGLPTRRPSVAGVTPSAGCR